jgi:MFS family permease
VPVLELLRRNRDFRVVFFAQVISFMGDWFATVALVGLVIDLTGSDLAASLVLVAQTLPAVPLTPLTGAAADRIDRRTLMIGISGLQALAALGFLFVGESTVWVGFVAMASVSGLGAFYLPASSAAVPNLVEPEDLATATAAMSATWGAMLAIGAALGGAFTVVFGRDAAFVADAITFAVAGSMIATVRRPLSRAAASHTEQPRMRPIADTIEAVRYARANHYVLALLASKMGFGLSAGIVGLLPVFATEVFDAGDAGIGALYAARGVGVVLGPWVAWRLAGRGVNGILFACGVAALGYACAYSLLPLVPSLGVAVVAVAVAHLGGGAQWTLSTYGLQIVTPDELRGRIFAADFALVTLTMACSSIVAGALSQRYGPEAVIAGLVAVSAAWGTTYLLLTRNLRHAPEPDVVTT